MDNTLQYTVLILSVCGLVVVMISKFVKDWFDMRDREEHAAQKIREANQRLEAAEDQITEQNYRLEKQAEFIGELMQSSGDEPRKKVARRVRRTGFPATNDLGVWWYFVPTEALKSVRERIQAGDDMANLSKPHGSNLWRFEVEHDATRYRSLQFRHLAAAQAWVRLLVGIDRHVGYKNQNLLNNVKRGDNNGL